MITTSIIGASGYTGAELVKLVTHHPQFELVNTFVSANSSDANKLISEIHGHLWGRVDSVLLPLQQAALKNVAEESDVVFLATPHEISHHWVAELANLDTVVIDLSGAYRLKDKTVFAQAYGFDNHYDAVLEHAVYGLADWFAEDIAQANIIAVPGCYPTASLLALKPLQQSGIIDPMQRPVINATSGVSGAGRKASLASSLCEVSLQAYGVLNHRHTPEIEAYLGTQVVFTPHLGNFKRGILATITTTIRSGVTSADIDGAYTQAYKDNTCIRLRKCWPKLDDVVFTPFCDLHWAVDVSRSQLVVSSAIDNLLKGAAAQALQCANLRFGFPAMTGLTLEQC